MMNENESQADGSTEQAEAVNPAPKSKKDKYSLGKTKEPKPAAPFDCKVLSDRALDGQLQASERKGDKADGEYVAQLKAEKARRVAKEAAKKKS